MRHQHAGLAIPDFPAAYGHVWPALDAESVARYNQNRVEVNAANPITAFQIVLQMGHRFLALVILLLVLASAWLAQRRLGRSHLLASICGAWFGLILVQVLLGAATVWTGKSADIATAHVAVGALLLMTGTMLVILASGCLVPVAKVGQRVPPAPNREGRRDARPTLSFKSSVLSLLRMHWDHEPGRAQRRAGVPPAQRARQRERFRSVGVADGGRRDACPTLRFMERTSPIKWP